MPTFSRTAGLRARALAAACGGLAALLLLPALALAEVALYQAAVPLQGTTAADRAAGFGEALRIAAVRASGRREAAANPVIAAAAGDASRFVQQYAMTPDHLLKVGLDARGVEQLLQQAGLPLWPTERPQTLVELFVPDVAGASRAVLASEHPPERAELERAAQIRGVPIVWPQQPIDLARARSAPPAGTTRALLLGVAAQGQISWTFSHAGESVRGQGDLRAGVDLAADTLAARYAPASTRELTTQSVRVGGMSDLQAYAGLLQYVQSLSLVRAVSVEGLDGETVRLKLSLRGDLELLRRIAALDARLQPAAAAAGEVDRAGADFIWQP